MILMTKRLKVPEYLQLSEKEFRNDSMIFED